jgi:hypothetical protein
VKDYVLNLDRPRHLKFGFGAARLIRQKFGDRSVEDILNMKVDEMPFVAWAGLAWEDPELTAEQVEKLIDAKIGEEYTISDVVNIVSDAITRDFGGEPEKKKKSTPSKRKESSPGPSGSRTRTSKE